MAPSRTAAYPVTRWLLAVLISVALAGGACGPGGAPAGSASPDDEAPEGPDGAEGGPSAVRHPGVRFVFRNSGDAGEPLYVQLDTESRPVSWLDLLQDAEVVHFRPRCDVPDCGDPGEAVCGATLPRLRRLPEGAAVEHAWDGNVSRVTEDGCEVREPAPEGRYVARFCYGRGFDPFGRDSDSDSDGSRLGRVRDTDCTDRAFRIPGVARVEAATPARP